MSGMFVNQRGVLVQQNESDNKKELRELRDAIVWQTQRLENAAAKNKGRTVIHNHIDTKWGTYINDTVFHKK